MKILQIIVSLDPAGGGPAETAKQINVRFNRAGHRATVISLDSPGDAFPVDPSVNKLYLGPRYLKKWYSFSPRLLPWLKAHAREYDCVIVHGIWSYPGFAAWLALRNSGIPYFVFVHGMLDPWFKKAYPLKHLKKLLYWPWAEYRVLRDAKAVLFTCEEERLLARKSFRLYRCKETVVPYGIASPPADAEEQRKIFFEKFPHLRGKRIVLFLGRIHPKKGCDMLLDAFVRTAHSDVSLHLVLSGPDQLGWRAKLEDRARELGVSGRVTWTGMLHGNLVWGAFYAAEVFVLPSHQENFGISAVQAMSCGVPVLITDKVNIWREILGGGAGFADKDDLSGIIGLLNKWLGLTPEQRSLMSEKAKACFLKSFRIEGTMSELTAVLEEAVRGRGS